MSYNNTLDTHNTALQGILDAISNLPDGSGGGCGSYLTFISGRTGDELDAALGYKNEDYVQGIGEALARYALYKDTTGELTIADFAALKKCDTFEDFDADAIAEMQSNTDIMTLLNKSSFYPAFEPTFFARAVADLAGIQSDYRSFDDMIADNTALNAVLDSAPALQYLIDNTTLSTVYPMYAMYQQDLVKTKFDVYDTVGTSTITIPDDVNAIMVVLIGGGGPKLGNYDTIKCGAYRVYAIDTTVNKEFTVTVPGNNAAASFGEYTAEAGAGRDLYGNTEQHYLCGLSANGSDPTGYGGMGGTGGGYGGGTSYRSGNGTSGGYGGQGGYGGADGAAGTGDAGENGAGGKGTYYFGSGGSNGEGCVVVYHKR